MVFSNLIFLYLFLPVCLIAYFFCPGIRAKNAVLILFSLIFYAWGEPVYPPRSTGTSACSSSAGGKRFF